MDTFITGASERPCSVARRLPTGLLRPSYQRRRRQGLTPTAGPAEHGAGDDGSAQSAGSWEDRGRHGNCSTSSNSLEFSEGGGTAWPGREEREVPFPAPLAPCQLPSPLDLPNAAQKVSSSSVSTTVFISSGLCVQDHAQPYSYHHVSPPRLSSCGLAFIIYFACKEMGTGQTGPSADAPQLRRHFTRCRAPDVCVEWLNKRAGSRIQSSRSSVTQRGPG